VGERRNAFALLGGRAERKKAIGRTTHRREDITET
jgi:hypothetical protein